MTPTTLHLKVSGMTCGHCEQAVRQAVEALDAAAQVSIDRPHERVDVRTTADPAAVCAAIREEGYTVSQQAQ